MSSDNKKNERSKSWIWILAFVVFYIITVVPMGMALYTIKSELGWNVFSNTGYHAFAKCVRQEIHKTDLSGQKKPEE